MWAGGVGVFARVCETRETERENIERNFKMSTFSVVLGTQTQQS